MKPFDLTFLKAHHLENQVNGKATLIMTDDVYVHTPVVAVQNIGYGGQSFLSFTWHNGSAKHPQATLSIDEDAVNYLEYLLARLPTLRDEERADVVCRLNYRLKHIQADVAVTDDDLQTLFDFIHKNAPVGLDTSFDSYTYHVSVSNTQTDELVAEYDVNSKDQLWQALFSHLDCQHAIDVIV